MIDIHIILFMIDIYIILFMTDGTMYTFRAWKNTIV